MRKPSAVKHTRRYRALLEILVFVGLILGLTAYQRTSVGPILQGVFLPSSRALDGYLPPPPNDDCADEINVTSEDLPFTDTQDTREATNESGEPETTCGSSSYPTQSNSVWYGFTNTSGAPQLIGASTAGSDYDTVLQVYTGGCGAFVPLVCDDDSGPGLTSKLYFVAEPGVLYKIKVADWGSPPGGGALVFNLEVLPPIADLSVGKADSPDPVTVGSNLTYTITVTNNGPMVATGVTLTDTLPGGVTFVSATPTQGDCAEAGGTIICNLGTLASSETATVTVVIIPTTAPPGAIAGTTGAVVEIAPPPSVVHGAFESNTEIRAFNEAQNLTLPVDIAVNISAPGIYDDWADLTPATIPAGTVVSSHFLHLDPVGTTTAVDLEGSVTFNADIIGVIVVDNDLDNSDDTLGATGTQYPINDHRQLELQIHPDRVTLDPDLRTLTVRFYTYDKVDQIRVITKRTICDIASVTGNEEDPDSDNNSTEECTAINPALPGSITIVKETNPAGGTGFDFSGDLGNFTLNDGDNQTFTDLDAGDYDVTEDVPAGWNLDSVICTGGDSTPINNGVTIHLNSGEDITCTFNNTFVARPTGEATDSVGVGQDTYAIDETVYATGSGFTPNTDVDVYIVGDLAWTDGMAIPLDVSSDGMNTVPTDATGNLGPASVWPPPLTPGEYDMVFDANRNGVYDAATDVVDHPAHPGFVVQAPPVPVGGVIVPVNSIELVLPYLGLAALAALAALTVALIRRRRA